MSFQNVRDENRVSVAALFTWMVTILAGLTLLVIWIIEYDPEFQRSAATRLPVPVISAHALHHGLPLTRGASLQLTGQADFWHPHRLPQHDPPPVPEARPARVTQDRVQSQP
jgi:hypothetical protein